MVVIIVRCRVYPVGENTLRGEIPELFVVPFTLMYGKCVALYCLAGLET